MIASALAVIPARLASSRLPRKPLLPLAGRPLIEWVWRRACDTGLFRRVVVATDSAEVAGVVRGFGGEAVMTSPDHLSGTDRVAEVARQPAFSEFDVIVNVQGDEPFLCRAQVQGALELVAEGDWGVGTAAVPLRDPAEYLDPAVVKVARAPGGAALYFSRAPIPFARDGTPTADGLAGGPFLRHLGIYAYRGDALVRWVELPEAPLERVERLEQLRPLSAGISIGVALVEGGSVELGVDTPADAVRADALLQQQLDARGAPL